MAVHKHKRPDGAEAAKVDCSETRRAGRNELAFRRIDLRKLIQNFLDVRRAFQLEFVALIIVTGLTAVRSVRGMREPVITI